MRGLDESCTHVSLHDNLYILAVHSRKRGYILLERSKFGYYNKLLLQHFGRSRLIWQIPPLNSVLIKIGMILLCLVVWLFTSISEA